MGFWAWLDRTRKKPKAVRNQYAFLAATSITACIALIWGVSLPSQWSDLATEDSPEDEAIGAFAGFWNDAKANIGNLTANTLQGLASTTPEEEAVASSTAPETVNEPGVIIPQLNQATIASATAAAKPPARTVLIATTTSSSSEE